MYRSLEVGRPLRHRYGAYDPSPVVSSRTCLASSTNEPGTSTSLGPAARKSGASNPGARWISDGMPASFSTPSISSATDSSGAAATFTHLSSMYVSYLRQSPEARKRGVTTVTVATMKYKGWLESVFAILLSYHTEALSKEGSKLQRKAGNGRLRRRHISCAGSWCRDEERSGGHRTQRVRSGG